MQMGSYMYMHFLSFYIHIFFWKLLLFFLLRSTDFFLQFDDPEENRNLAMDPDMELPLAVFSERLHAGWRAEASDYDK